ncbi:AMIN-like domain-containing (lipo)protein [Pseudarthrobacter sp. 1C304]|uniref:AMIN-like domain-containing (lipo)protein n=1 Tax=Pseudarthrobacter sp. 1C304 TaxID=3457438 RepID=UPI003FD37C64
MMKFRVWLVAVLLAVGSALVAPGPASAAPYCGLVWGSLVKADPALSQAQVTDVRTGQHYCFDRLVIDLNGPVAGYTVRYVPQVVQDGSGFPIALRGQAFLQVTANAPAYDENGNATYSPANPNELTDVTGYQTFRQVAWAGSFEGYSSLGLGVRARLPFRVFTLEGPGAGSRLVIDVAHFW